MRVFLTTLGCRLNEAEVAGWSRAFSAAGHDVVPAPERAEVMVVNTCAVTGEAARKSRKLVGRLHRANPSAALAVTGCFASLEPERAAALAGVDLVVDNADKDRLVAEVTTQLGGGAMPALATEPGSVHVYPERLAPTSHTRAFIKVQDGCRNKCSFCIVTVARGQERSRALADIVSEVRRFEAEGVCEVVLTGVHLGGYGSDLGSDLSALVRAILAHTSVPRVRLSSLEPWDLPADFGELWDDARLMPHLHLPLQSGSDSVLRRMARRCFTGEYARLVDGLRARIPDLCVTTDLIVGFPGETDAEHAETLAFAERIGFSHVHVFSYSPREGTRAAALPGRVPGPVIRERSRELHELAARMKAEHLARHVGTTRSVLWERGSHEGGAIGGYTDNYLRVRALAVPPDLDGRITAARLSAVAGAELVAEPIAP